MNTQTQAAITIQRAYRRHAAPNAARVIHSKRDAYHRALRFFDSTLDPASSSSIKMRLEHQVGQTSQSTNKRPVLKALLDVIAKDGLPNSHSINAALLTCYSTLGGNDATEIDATLDKTYRNKGDFLGLSQCLQIAANTAIVQRTPLAPALQAVFEEVKDLKSDIRTVACALAEDVDFAQAYLDFPGALRLYCGHQVPTASTLDDQISNIAESLFDLGSTEHSEIRDYLFRGVDGYRRKQNVNYVNRVTDPVQQKHIKQTIKDSFVRAIFKQVLDELNTASCRSELSLVRALGI